jgi:hypothetical protein
MLLLLLLMMMMMVIVLEDTKSDTLTNFGLRRHVFVHLFKITSPFSNLIHFSVMFSHTAVLYHSDHSVSVALTHRSVALPPSSI